MSDWDAFSAELIKPLDAKHVKPPPQGKYGEYVEAHHVIEEANRIFGFGGWSYGVVELRLTNEAKDAQDKHHIGYLATVAVQIGDVKRCDVGHGQGHGKSHGDAHDSAVKEAVTDGLKRALRTFGNTFGLALYDKTKANVQDSAEIERKAQQEAAAQTAYDDLIVYLNETDDEALEGFVDSHKQEINRLGVAIPNGGFGRSDLFDKLGQEIKARKEAARKAA